MTAALEELSGVFSRVHWMAEGEGQRFIIASLDDQTSVKGEADPEDLIPGIEYRFLGRWGKPHAKYGKAFEFKTFVRQEPHSRGGVVQYLIRYGAGIGPVYASQLWDAFGTNAVRELRTNPEGVAARLPKIPRSKIDDAALSLQTLAATEDTRIELATLFEGRGFSSKLPELLIKRWGVHAPARVRRDPFTLLVHKFPSCGFDRCDRMYVDLGLPLDRLKRRLMCIWRALRENNDGHTWHPIEVAQVAIAQHITGVPNAPKGWAHAVRLGVRAGWLTTRQDKAGKWFLAEKKAADNEGIIARKLAELSDAKPRLTWPDPDTLDVGKSDHQREIARLVFKGNVAILAGTPGTGKTTLAAAIIKAITGEHGREFTAVIAPTGKAAVRMEEGLHARKLSGITVGTIHRILGVTRNGHDGDGWGFIHNEDNPLPYDLIVIDESSMVDIDTLANLLKAISRGTLVLFVGDPYQLPPVGHGAPLRDMIAAKLPYGELTEVRRNDGEIVQVCRRIKSGERIQPPARIDIANGRNWAHFQLGTEAQIRLKLVQAIRSLAGVELQPGQPINPVWDTQVIVALNDKGELNRKAVSEALQAILNPDGEQCEGNQFRVGDKVICTSNAWLKLLTEDADDFDEPDEDDEGPQDFVANGEIGQVVAITKKHTDVRFASPARTVRVPRGGKNGNFELGYAITFHRSQGSQWPVVILLADPSANRMASRELWYTGISRAETLAVTIGQLATIARQCRRVALVDRKTFLVDRIREETDSLTRGDE